MMFALLQAGVDEHVVAAAVRGIAGLGEAGLQRFDFGMLHEIGRVLSVQRVRFPKHIPLFFPGV
jgi:predicted regulator of Ras-like GTPase activity (Roadblock/LC7/MglB family)